MLRTICISSLAALALIWMGSTAMAAPTNFVGLNTHQPADDVLDAAKALGVPWVRIDFNWFQAEPSKGKYNWTLFDKIINNAIARGLKVFPTIGYGPAWAKDPAHQNKDGKTHNDTPKAGEYQKFCQVAAARYKGKITHWGLWNEPNLDFLETTDKNIWINRIVLEGIKGIKAGCPSCKVLGPELASVGKIHASWFDASLKALKKAGLMYDIITWHNYAAFHEIKPNYVPACPGGDYYEHDLEKGRRCFGVLIGAKAPYEVMQDNKVTHIPLWMTETGYKAPVGDSKKTGEQVTYYRRVLEEQLKRSWYTATFFYEIVDDNNIADKWGMAVRNSGSGQKWPGSYKQKPVWGFMKKALANQPKFGGSGTDCNDGLDNDGDKKIDYPQDTGCSSASDPTETPGGTPKPDAGKPKLDKGGPGPKLDKGGPGPKLDKGGPGPKLDKGGPGPKKDKGGTGPKKDGKAGGKDGASKPGADAATPPAGGAGGACAVSTGGGGRGALILIIMIGLFVTRRRP